MFVQVYKCVDVCFQMCVCLCEGEVQLTCKQAHISPHGMSHDPGNTEEDNLQNYTKEPDHHGWIFYIQNKILRSFSFSLFLCHPPSSTSLLSWQETDAHSSMSLLWHQHTKSVNWFQRNKMLHCWASCINLFRARQHKPPFPPSCTSNDKFLSLYRLCEGYQGCLLNNHHVWNTVMKPWVLFSLDKVDLAWQWLQAKCEVWSYSWKRRKAAVLMDFGSLQ